MTAPLTASVPSPPRCAGSTGSTYTRASFATPWHREHFVSEITQNSLALNRVLRRDDEVVGYACVWRIGDELKINNVAVRSDLRSRGVGRWIVGRLLAEATELGCRVATLEVRPSNIAAIRLYEGLGFAEVGRRNLYYAREREDAILMDLRLPAAGRS